MAPLLSIVGRNGLPFLNWGVCFGIAYIDILREKHALS